MIRAFAVVAVVAANVANAGQPVELTQEEFKMYTHYKRAMGDARVQKLKPEAQAGAIAKDAGYKLKDLQRAIERGEAAGNVQTACEANIKEALGQGDLKGRIGKVEVDVSEPHAVAYVQWFNEAPEKLPVEASYAAAQTNGACPILSTIQVWAHNKGSPKARVFQALISAGAASKINVEKVKDWAETRYLRLFEKVKSVANGDDLSGELAAPNAATP